MLSCNNPSECRCAPERDQAFAEVRARVQRVKVTEAMQAEAAAKQACYEHQRRAWLKQWREHYGIEDGPQELDPQHVTTATLLL